MSELQVELVEESEVGEDGGRILQVTVTISGPNMRAWEASAHIVNGKVVVEAEFCED